jgi:hypothetical protein
MSVGISAALVFCVHSALPAKAKKKDEVKNATLTYAHFQRLDRGMDEAQVIAILGRPVGITRPEYVAKYGRTQQEWKVDPSAICYVYRSVVAHDLDGYFNPRDEWLVAFVNGKAVFWNRDGGQGCASFFD